VTHARSSISPGEYEVERLYREVPMLLVGEGAAEIQKMIIGRPLPEEYRVPR
jgi:alkylation response protein AidB-like acyl-CoA dehydrogenase